MPPPQPSDQAKSLTKSDARPLTACFSDVFDANKFHFGRHRFKSAKTEHATLRTGNRESSRQPPRSAAPSTHPHLHVQVCHLQCVPHDEIPPRLHHVAH